MYSFHKVGEIAKEADAHNTQHGHLINPYHMANIMSFVSFPGCHIQIYNHTSWEHFYTK